MKRILVTGANSYIGTSFADYLAKYFPDFYVVDTVDMKGKNWRKKSFAGYDSIFHVAGIAHSDAKMIAKKQKEAYYKVNRDLTIETAKKAKIEGVRQFVFMSSAIVYGDSAPIGKAKRITKNTSPSPSNAYGNSKLQAEQGIQLLEDEQFLVAILRPPMVYGKGSKGNYARLAKMAQRIPIFPDISNRRSMLYIEHLCEFVRLIVEREERGIFWPQNAEYSNTSELVGMIAAAHGKSVYQIKGVTWALKLAGLFLKPIQKVFGNFYYEPGMSQYEVEYRKYNLAQSIALTEKTNEKSSYNRFGSVHDRSI